MEQERPKVVTFIIGESVLRRARVRAHSENLTVESWVARLVETTLGDPTASEWRDTVERRLAELEKEDPSESDLLERLGRLIDAIRRA